MSKRWIYHSYTHNKTEDTKKKVNRRLRCLAQNHKKSGQEKAGGPNFLSVLSIQTAHNPVHTPKQSGSVSHLSQLPRGILTKGNVLPTFTPQNL